MRAARSALTRATRSWAYRAWTDATRRVAAAAARSACPARRCAERHGDRRHDGADTAAPGRPERPGAEPCPGRPLVVLVRCRSPVIGAVPSTASVGCPSPLLSADRPKTVAPFGYNWCRASAGSPSIPSSFTELAAAGVQLGPVGTRRPARHAQPHRRGRPARGVAAVGTGTPSPWACPFLPSRGHPDGLHPGPGEPHPHHGLGQRAPRPDPGWVAFSEDVVTLAMQCATHWDGLAHASYGAGPEGGRLYNGYPASRSPRTGPAELGIQRPVRWCPGGAARRGPGQGPGDPRARLSDHPRRPRRGLRPRRTGRRARRRGPGPDRPDRPPGPGRATRPRRGRAGAGPAGLHLAHAGPDHGHGRVVPRPRRGRGGHRHAGARGLPVRVPRLSSPCTSCTWWRWG